MAPMAPSITFATTRLQATMADRFTFLGPNSPGWSTTGGNGRRCAPRYREGVMGCNEACSVTQIADGTSHTIMLGELRAGTTPVDRRGTWAMGTAGASSLWGHGVSDDHGPNADNIQADDIKSGPEIGSAAGGSEILEIQGMGLHVYRLKSSQATSRSQHAGGVNVALCDGSVHFISDDIDHGSNDPQSRRFPSIRANCTSGNASTCRATVKRSMLTHGNSNSRPAGVRALFALKEAGSRLDVIHGWIAFPMAVDRLIRG